MECDRSTNEMSTHPCSNVCTVRLITPSVRTRVLKVSFALVNRLQRSQSQRAPSSLHFSPIAAASQGCIVTGRNFKYAPYDTLREGSSKRDTTHPQRHRSPKLWRGTPPHKRIDLSFSSLLTWFSPDDGSLQNGAA